MLRSKDSYGAATQATDGQPQVLVYITLLLGTGLVLLAPLYPKGNDSIQQAGLMLISGALAGARFTKTSNQRVSNVEQFDVWQPDPNPQLPPK